MKLTDIHKNYETDKGTDHSYIEHYERMFQSIRKNKLNVLEIGVLFGGSLKMWNDYFENSNIYGIENFFIKDGHRYHNYKPVDPEKVIENLSPYERIKLLVFDCESINDIKLNLLNIKFDIIIDDASHQLNQQINNFKNYSKYLKNDGIYVCEDVQTNENGVILKNMASIIFPNKKSEVINFNVNKRSDDRLFTLS